MTTDTIIDNRLTRQQQLSALRKRDGATCQYPACGEVMDFSLTDGPNEVTIDHWMPQYWCKNNSWTREEIWDLSNLKLMHKRCNAKKGDRIPNDDGTLPEKIVRKFRYRRDKRAGRPGLCDICDNGHNLAFDEICGSCGGDAQAFPRSAKVKTQDCDHEILWCIWCSIGVIERAPAINSAMRHGMSEDEREPDEN
jgi:hypothetical protein